MGNGNGSNQKVVVRKLDEQILLLKTQLAELEKANEAADPGDAAPAAHKITLRRSIKKTVFIKDTNWTDEDLGKIELRMDCVKTASGQIYVVNATARPDLTAAAASVLTLGADIKAFSFDYNGKKYAEVLFICHVGGPNVASTSTVGAGLEIGAETSSKLSAKGNLSVSFSTSNTSSAAMNFMRRFHINADLKTNQIESDDFKGLRIDDSAYEAHGHGQLSV